MNINYDAEHEGYVVLTPSGNILISTYAHFHSASLELFLLVHAKWTHKNRGISWRYHYNRGYRCVRAGMYIKSEKANI